MKESFPEKPVLIVDDEEDVLSSYKMALQFEGISNLILCQDSKMSFDILAQNEISVAIVDLFMPEIKGQDILKHIKEKYPHIPVIVVTGSNSVDTAVDCMKEGAADYMVKPVENSRLISSLRMSLEMNDLQNEVATLKNKVLSNDLVHPEYFSSILTTSDSMHSIFRYIEAIARSSKPVLITGESGVGKELVARAVHDASGRKGSFVAVNLGGLDDTMFSDALFGHKKGAFTGADSPRQGLVEQASGGTLFLDEIGDLDTGSQIKLLRLLQDREYYPLGSDVIKLSDARIVAATNTELEKKQREGTFRNDLYYRLITHHVSIPSLRERMEDLPLLIDRFVVQAAESVQRKTPAISEEFYTLLSSYDFPGNIRELQSVVFEAVLRSGPEFITPDSAKEYIRKNIANREKALHNGHGAFYSISYSGRFPTLKEVEDFFIEEALRKSNGNQTVAAAYLGVNQSTLSRRQREKKGE
jgi:two-component system response regulator HydG